MTMLHRFDVNDLLAEARAALTRLTPAEAFAAQQTGALLLDTRVEADRDREGVIPGSLHTPLSVIQWVVDPASGYAHPEIDRFDRTLIVVCNEGYSSSLAAASLKRLGFVNATDLNGGYRGWKAHGFPTCAVAAATDASQQRQPLRRTLIKGALYRLFLRAFQ
jgi:rhodanese-related sulfurtransferase